LKGNAVVWKATGAEAQEIQYLVLENLDAFVG